MSVGTGSLKRTAKSVSSSAKDAENSQTEKQAVKTETVRRRTAAKTTDRAAAPKTAKRTAAAKKNVVAADEKTEQTSGITCELPVYLL